MLIVSGGDEVRKFLAMERRGDYDSNSTMSQSRSPRVSVIIPVFNQGDYLSHAVESVLRQSWTDWECVVIDDGSTDATPFVATELAARDDRIKVIRQSNHGLSAARNRGIQESSGEFLQFLDGDDLLASKKLEIQVGYLESNPDVDIVYSDITFFRSEAPLESMWSMGGVLSRSLMVRVRSNESALQSLEHHNIMPVLAALSRRCIVQKAGAFDEGVESHEDHALWLRCAAIGAEFFHLPAAGGLASVRVHGGSMSHDRERMIRGLIQCARAFERRKSAVSWERSSLPLIYEFALGADATIRGRRWVGSRRIWRAASEAREPATRLRWSAYALGSLMLPRLLFGRLVTMPVSERLYELYRRLIPRSGDY